MTFVLPNRLVFVHIPKTGGVSIKRVLSGLGESSIIGYHDTAVSLRTRINWEDHFSFAFVRNPWARALSIFLMQDRNNSYRWLTPRSFVEFLHTSLGPDRWEVNHQNTQASFIYDGNLQLVNFLGRFETLQEDWSTVAKKLDLPTELPHLNRGNPVDYHDYYDGETKAIVARNHAEDIERFNYRF